MVQRLFLLFALVACAGCAPRLQETAPASDESSTASSLPVAADTEWEVPSLPPEPPSVSGSLLPSGAIALGAANAPHTLLVITHPSCRYCKEFARRHLPRLIDAFVRDGSLRIDLLIRPLSKFPDSMRIASVAVCAARQGQGGRIHGALANVDNLDAAALKALVNDLRLDPQALDACLGSGATLVSVEAAAAVADSLHANLVPTFILDGALSTGLPDYAELQSRIREVIDAR